VSDECAGRRNRLLEDLKFGSAQGIILTSHASVRYLTGFTGSHASLCGSVTGWTLVTDARYVTQAAIECPGVPVHVDRNSFDHCTNILLAQGVKVVWVEESLTAVHYVQAVDSFDRVIVDSQPLTSLRSIKSTQELQSIRAAARITASALSGLAAEITLGLSEREIALALESRFFSEGADGVAFETIVAAGANSALPHHRPSDYRLRAGDLLVIDCGASVAGYRADMTRTFVAGSEPDAWQKEIHEVVIQAHSVGIDSLIAGRGAAQIDELVRDRVGAGGYGAEFSHGTGHGVGLDIHEWPLLVPGGAGTIRASMALTIEPGVYLVGRGGVRVEDTVVVTDGPPQILTESDRALARVG
jgi:Xaa-Pro aminopeptidase